MQNLHIAGSDKPVGFYSLNVIISVGYRVKSLRGTQFRIWATQVLRDHLVKDYSVNAAACATWPDCGGRSDEPTRARKATAPRPTGPASSRDWVPRTIRTGMRRWWS